MALALLLGGGRHLFLAADEARYENMRNKIADERFMQHQYGHSRKSRTPETWPKIQNQPDERHARRYIIQCGGIGVHSWHGPRDYLIDECGLTDPLLARMPAVHFKAWRTGHHHRWTPTDWGNLLTGEADTLADPELAGLAADILLATRGDIFRAERFAAIWRLNTGHHDNLDLRRYRALKPVPRSSFPARFVSSAHIRAMWTLTNILQFNRSLHVTVSDPRPVAGMQLSLDCDNAFEVYVDGKPLSVAQGREESCAGLANYSIDFPAPAPIKTIEVRATGEGGSAPWHSLGYLRLSHTEG